LKKKIIFFFVPFTLLLLILIINNIQVKFKNYCFILSEFNSKQIDLNKLNNNTRINIINEIDIIGKNLNNFIRIGNFKVLTSSIDNKCLHDLEFMNQNLSHLNKVFVKNLENTENYKIIIESSKINLIPLFYFLFFLLYLFMLVFLFYFFKLLFNKKYLK